MHMEVLMVENKKKDPNFFQSLDSWNFHETIMILFDLFKDLMILKGKATYKTTCLDLIVALPYFRNIWVKKPTMPPK